MTDEQLAAMHRLLAKYHRNLAKEATLDVVQQYHADLAQRLADEAALIPRRTAILERLHEREPQKKEVAMSTNDNARLLDEGHCARQRLKQPRHLQE
jgi:type III secretory pathway component EscV